METRVESLADNLSRYWWVLLLRGIVAILFGVMAFAQPGKMLATLILFFAAFAFVDGIFNLVHAFGTRKENENWWVLLIEGLLGIAFGILAYRAPGVVVLTTTLVLVLYIAAWAMITGVMRIILAIRLRKEIEGEWMLALSGIVSVVFGLLILGSPGAGAVTMTWFIAAWAVVLGIIMIVLSFQARSFGKKLQAVTAQRR